jgi:excinuclease ABC subunit C
MDVPGVGARTAQRLVQHFGSVKAVKEADATALSAVVTRSQAEAILNYFRQPEPQPESPLKVLN